MYKFERVNKSQPTLLENVLLDIRIAINCEFGILYLFRGGKLYVEAVQGINDYSYKNGQFKEKKIHAIDVDETTAAGYSFIYNKTVNPGATENNIYHNFNNEAQKYDDELGIKAETNLFVPISNYSGAKIGVIQLVNALDKDGKVINFNNLHERAARVITTYFNMFINNAKEVYVADDMLRNLARYIACRADERQGLRKGHSRRVVNLTKNFMKYLKVNEHLAVSEEENDLSIIALFGYLKDIACLENEATDVVQTENAKNIYFMVKTRLLAIKEQRKFQVLKELLQGDFTDRESLQKHMWHDIEEIEDEMSRALDFVEMLDQAACIINDTAQRYADELASRSWLNAEGKEEPWMSREESTVLIRECPTEESDKSHLELDENVVLSLKLLQGISFNNKYKVVPEFINKFHEYQTFVKYPLGDLIIEPPLLVVALQVINSFELLIEEGNEYSETRAEKIIEEMIAEGKHNQTMLMRFKASGLWKNKQILA